MLDNRLAYGKDAYEDGGTNYNNTLSICHGTVNVVNYLTTWRKVVHEDNRTTPAKLKEALDSNFEGEQGHIIRKLLFDAPKYENNIDEADYKMINVLNWYDDEITSYTPTRGGHHCISCQRYVDAYPQWYSKGLDRPDSI